MKKSICSFLIILFLSSSFGLKNSAFAADYYLAPSDILEIKIIGQKELDTRQAIAPDGTVSLPLLGRVTAQGQTLKGFNEQLSAEFAKYIKNPQVVVYLTPRPIYVIQHDLRKNTWDVKEARSVDEARALAGRDYAEEIRAGDVVSVEVGKKADWWEDNWYKVLTGVAVAVGMYTTLR